MIKKVRRKFIIIAMAAMISCTAVLVAAINLVNFYQVNQETTIILQSIAENDGQFPTHVQGLEELKMQGNAEAIENGDALQPPKMGNHNFTKEIAYETRYFTVTMSPDNTVVKSNLKNIAMVDEDTAEEMAKTATATNKKTGYIGNYKFYIQNKITPDLTENNPMKTVVIMDCETKISAMKTLAVTSTLIAGLGILIMFLIITLFSRKAIQPVIESTEKQKQFITDASHELKTPLTVVATNMDILEMDLGKNEWVEGTKKQVTNMRNMVNQMVSLCRMEEETLPLVISQFDFSNAVTETAEPFASMAEFEGKNFATKIIDHIQVKGDESALRALVTILCDNAVKYSNAQGDIQVTLDKNGKKAVLKISNLCDEKVEAETLSRLFDRFYRADASRTRENGKNSYGIGLAIAKATVEKHGGKITVKQDQENRITFSVTI